jgi:tetratricopeptide (TPR) repeat protein
MKMFQIASIVTLTTALQLFSVSVSAQNMNSSIERWDAIGEIWERGAVLEEQGEFEAAQAEYQRAVQLSNEIDDQLLQYCASLGSVARMRGAVAARAILMATGTTPTSIQAAHAAADTAFREAIEMFDQMRPDLATSCP